MRYSLLAEGEIRSRLKERAGWARAGNEIRRLFEFEDFVRAVGFVQSVALLAEKHNHHPDIDIRWNKVTLTLSTHSAGGLTEMDFTLAKAIDEL